MVKGLILLLCCGPLFLLPSCSHKAASHGEPQGKHPVFRHVSPQDAYSLMQAHHRSGMLVVVDLRTPEEFEKERVEGAINVSYYSQDFRKALEALDRDKIYLIYCRTGKRSGETVQMMKVMGFRTVYPVSGGIQRWLADDLPLVP